MKRNLEIDNNKESRKGKRMAGFVILLILYFIASALTVLSARSTGAITIKGNTLPLSIFAGVFSSICNTCTFFLVLFYEKRGFITSLIFIILQAPMLLLSIIKGGVLTSIPGLFSGLFTIVAIVIIYNSGKKIRQYQTREIENLKEKQQISQKLFEQTATALVNAIDAKDTYSHGHSLRVAEYSEQIAWMSGKSEEECNKIYYAALLHDVGKIGIDDNIINKKGKLTPEEYEAIKQHPIMGNQILSSINEYPYLSIGAHFHHERYDGKGYPNKLKGEDIPEIARIISVADAYDAMSSNRSYRDAIPQQLVREEIIKGAGTQFDPKFAKIMQHLIDVDTEYRMKERTSIRELAGKNELKCGEHRSEISDGIVVNPYTTKIHLKYTSGDEQGMISGPSLILFDSLDERVHDDPKTVKDLNYFEYCEIFFDGSTTDSGIRKVKTEVSKHEDAAPDTNGSKSTEYDIEAVKFKDHVLVVIDSKYETVKITIALPDSARFAYIGLTGENCCISDVSISKSETPITEDHIERIAEEISYINGPTGDLPNIQIDGFRYETTDGVLIKDGLEITFHTMSLPTARLVWHCPFITVFSSSNGKTDGEDYHEYELIRIDGESWDEEGRTDNGLIVNKSDDFKGWDAWKQYNKEGFDCKVTFKRDAEKITLMTENFGLSLTDNITIRDGGREVYAALTGDQVALTNIRIRQR